MKLPGASGEVARLSQSDAARALLEEHESDHVGPRVERRRQGRDGREAADFYRRGHAPLSGKTDGVSKGACLGDHDANRIPAGLRMMTAALHWNAGDLP